MVMMRFEQELYFKITRPILFADWRVFHTEMQKRIAFELIMID